MILKTASGDTGLIRSLIRRWLLAEERRAARHTIWLGLRTGVQIVGGAASMAFSARALGPEGFGVLAIFMTVTALVGGLLHLPAYEAITTYVTRSLTRGGRDEAAAVLRFALVGAVATAWLSYAAVVGLALAAGDWLGVADGYVSTLLIYATVNVFQAGHLEYLAILRLVDRTPPARAAMAAGQVVQVAVLAAAWQSDGGLPMVVAAYAAAAAVYGGSMCVSALVAGRRAGLPLSLRPFNVRVPRDMARFQVAAFTKEALRAICRNLDVLLVAQFVSTAQLGLYRGAWLLADICLRPFVPVALSAQIEYSRCWYAGSGVALCRLLRRFTLLTVIVAMAGYGLLALLCQPIIRLVLGADFVGVVDPLLIMIPGAFLFAGSMALHVLPAATGRGWAATLAELIALLVQVSALVLLTPAYGVTGAAWAYTIYALAFVVTLVPFVGSVLWRGSGSRA